MKKIFKILPVLIALCLIFAANAYASGKPSGEGSAEPAEVIAEPSAEPAQQTTTFVHEGEEYTVPVYTFNGEEYVKLEDLKEILSKTEKEETVPAEPAGNASGEPSGEASAEPEETTVVMEASGEPVTEETAVESSFDVTIRVNGSDYAVAPVSASVNGNTYTFQIGELLAAFGVELTYDEETNVASLSADVTSLLSALIAQQTAVSEQPASSEPAASEEPIVEEVVSETEAVPATDGTENQANVLASASQPATAEEYDAYEAYLVEYMNAYTGVGDGTFDDSAKAMALGELDSVSFGSDVNAFPFEMFVTQFGAMDYASFAASLAPVAEVAAEDVVPATDGTENQANVLASASQPATAEEYDAYEAYLVEYMNAYTGVGDGTFDDSAKAMALGELDSVSFGSDVNAFPFEMFVTQFGAMDYASFAANG